MSEWISVKDRLPEDLQRILVYAPTAALKVYEAQYKNLIIFLYDPWEDDYNCDIENAITDFYVTHWMPLPEPPKEQS